MVKKWGNAELPCAHLHHLHILSTIKTQDAFHLLEKDLLNVFPASDTTYFSWSFCFSICFGLQTQPCTVVCPISYGEHFLYGLEPLLDTLFSS